jgi:sialidase-1
MPVSETRHRRSFLKHSLAGTAAALLVRPLEVRAASRIEILDRRVISQLPQHYHGWPTLARRTNGQLVLAVSGGRESHVCPFGRVELLRSDDEGKSWSWPQVIMDTPIDDRDAGILETARGTLLATTFTSLAYEPILAKALADPSSWDADRLARWQAAHRQLSEKQRKATLGTWMVRSTDNGITWSQPYDCLVNSPHGPVRLADGRLLYAGKELWRENPRIGVARSEDDGVSWKWLAEIKPREGDLEGKYHELHAVEAANGRLVAQIRNHNPKDAGETLQSESSDGGETWTTPHSIGVWGLPSHLLRLSDDRLLMSYGYRRKPYGNQVRVSEDHGESWSAPLTLSADGAGHDLGYPSTVELADGSLLSAWYERLAGSSHAVLRQAHWTLQD